MQPEERVSAFMNTDIYPVICSTFTPGGKTVTLLQAVLEGGARIVQLREKDMPPAAKIRLGSVYRKLTDRYHALLIINDDPELAQKCNADGVHLGTEDMNWQKAAATYPELIIGASIHNEKEAAAAVKAGVTYFNIGPVFPTNTKKTAVTPTGTALVRKLARLWPKPFTVMGGINRDNINSVLAAGARRIAMVTGLSRDPDPAAATAWYKKKIREMI